MTSSRLIQRVQIATSPYVCNVGLMASFVAVPPRCRSFVHLEPSSHSLHAWNVGSHAASSELRMMTRISHVSRALWRHWTVSIRRITHRSRISTRWYVCNFGSRGGPGSVISEGITGILETCRSHRLGRRDLRKRGKPSRKRSRTCSLMPSIGSGRSLCYVQPG